MARMIDCENRDVRIIRELAIGTLAFIILAARKSNDLYMREERRPLSTSPARPPTAYVHTRVYSAKDPECEMHSTATTGTRRDAASDGHRNSAE